MTDLKNIKVCKRCDRIYKGTGGGLCRACTVQTDKDFIACRTYINRHQEVTIEELSEKTGVHQTVIMMFLREGRLTLGSKSELLCEMCNKAILTGRFCRSCMVKLNEDIDRIRSSLSKHSKMEGIYDKKVERQRF